LGRIAGQRDWVVITCGPFVCVQRRLPYVAIKRKASWRGSPSADLQQRYFPDFPTILGGLTTLKKK